MELNLGAITGLWLACTELSKQTQLKTLNPNTHFPSPSRAHTLLTVSVGFASLGIAPDGQGDTNSTRKRVSKHGELALCIWP